MSLREEERERALREAQQKAEALFRQVETRGLVRPGVMESRLNQDVYELAREMFGVTTYWHKRIVRAGQNTLAPYAENPPDLPIGEDEILFIDLGPVFEEWEADFGRTFVLGDDARKLKLKADVERAFAEGKQYFREHAEITARELYGHACALAARYGWEFGGPIAGHLIGHFPHERIADDKVTLYVHPQSALRMRLAGENGEQRHWILEIHFVDRAYGIGGFFEELLTVD